MRRHILNVSRGKFAVALLLILSYVLSLPAQARPPSDDPQTSSNLSSEQRTARHFESLRKSPPQLLAFLLAMPKGGDLHNHLSGAIYAESYIQWAADSGDCVNTTNMAVYAPPCALGQTVPAANALTNSALYNQLIDAWSLRNWQLSGQSGHDHFFDTFGKFGVATYNQTGRMLAEVVSRAARQHVFYLELMLTPEFVKTYHIGQEVGWGGNPEGTLAKLKSNGIEEAATDGVKNLQDAEAIKDRMLNCGTVQAEAGCAVTVRYIAQVSRASTLGANFAGMATGFILANDPNSKVVAVNLVQAEDAFTSMKNFPEQMRMLRFLKPLYPRAHLTLHAGELAPGLVPPEGLTFHVRDSVMIANAERIGHGVDIMHEDQPFELLKIMAQRNVLVEICLSSNDLILGVKGPKHPLATYLQYGVPVALATDDEGVLRTDISREFLKAAEEQGLDYLQLKTMARNSLQFAFISGNNLWSDGREFTPVAQCSTDLASMKLTSNHCRQYLATSAKAKLQWQLEENLNQFEQKY